MTDVRISVIVPTYHRARQVVEAIESVRAQTVPDWEAIVVDDGGADDTEARIAEVTARDPRVRYLRVAHGGPSAARNAGIAAARGEWLAFLDSDDRWEPERLRVAVEALQRDPGVAAVVTGYRFEGPDGAAREAPEPPAPGTGDRLVDLFERQFFLLQCVVARASALRDAGPLDETLPAAEDLDLGLRLAARGRLAVLPDVLTVVRRGGASITADPDSVRYRYGVLRRFLATHPGRVPSEIARRRLHAVAAGTGDTLLAAGRPAGAVPFLARALLHRPGDGRSWKNLVKSLRDLALARGQGSDGGPRVGAVMLRMGMVRAVALGVAIARTKVVALSLGSAGVGVLSQLAQFVNLLGVAAFLGLSRGLVREVSRRAARPEEGTPGDLRATAVRLLAGTTVGITLLAAVAAAPLSTLLFGEPKWAGLIVLGALSVPFTVAVQYWGCLLSAHRDLDGQALAAAGGGWTAALPVMILAPTAGLIGASAAIPIAGAVACAFAWTSWRRSPARPAWLASPGRVDPSLARILLGFGAVGVLGALAENASMTVVRRLVFDAGGEAAGGHYQAALGLSRTLTPLLLATLSLETFPRLSAAAPPQRADELRRTFRAALLLCAPVAALLSLAPAGWLHLLYDAPFRAGAPALRFQVLSDWLDVVPWAAICAWTAEGRLARVLLVNTFVCALHVAGSAGLIPLLGAAGAPAGHALARVAEIALVAALARGTPLPDLRGLVAWIAGAAVLAALALGA